MRPETPVDFERCQGDFVRILEPIISSICYLVRAKLAFKFYSFILVELQLSFNTVAVVQQYNRQVTHITHKQSTNILLYFVYFLN
jgi:hypothetical protein